MDQKATSVQNCIATARMHASLLHPSRPHTPAAMLGRDANSRRGTSESTGGRFHQDTQLFEKKTKAKNRTKRGRRKKRSSSALEGWTSELEQTDAFATHFNVESHRSSDEDDDAEDINDEASPLEMHNVAFDQAHKILDSFDGCEEDHELASELCEQLWKVVDTIFLPVRSSSKTRISKTDKEEREEAIRSLRWRSLGTVSHLLTLENANLQLKVARLIVRICRDALVKTLWQARATNIEECVLLMEPLCSACKELFAQSKKQEMDAAFFNEEALLDTLLSMLPSPTHGTENAAASRKYLIRKSFFLPLLYSIGCIKNISNATKNQRALAQKGAIGFLTSICRQAVASKTHAKRNKDAKRLCQLFVQATAALRNLALDKRHLNQFWTFGTVEVLADAITVDADDAGFGSNGDLVLNVSRILAKLSLYEQGREALMNAPSNPVRSLLHVVATAHPRHLPLAVRVFFVLGNLTAGNDENRRYVGETQGCSGVSMMLLGRYASMYIAKGSSESAVAAVEDVLIKLVRLIANMSISASLGMQMLASPGGLRLVELLSRAEQRRKRFSIPEEGNKRAYMSAEELVLNVVAATSNLLFYANACSLAPEEECLFAKRNELVPTLVDLLLHPNQEATLEALRALGNLSRDSDMKALLYELRVDEISAVLLDHIDANVVYGACGVLVNMATYGPTRARLSSRQLGCVRKLIDLLRANLDSTRASLMAAVCQTIYNYTMENKSAAKLRERIGGKMLISERRDLMEGLEKLLRTLAAANGGSDIDKAIDVARTLSDRLSSEGSRLIYGNAWEEPSCAHPVDDEKGKLESESVWEPL